MDCTKTIIKEQIFFIKNWLALIQQENTELSLGHLFILLDEVMEASKISKQPSQNKIIDYFGKADRKIGPG